MRRLVSHGLLGGAGSNKRGLGLGLAAVDRGFTDDFAVILDVSDLFTSLIFGFLQRFLDELVDRISLGSFVGKTGSPSQPEDFLYKHA